MQRSRNAGASSRASGWLRRWGPILPLLGAELVLWLGFGALLPILPLYFTARGIDLATLGAVIAAWPLARLVAEPVFGWIADRTARKPLMVGALFVSAVVAPLPLLFYGAVAFTIARAAAGLAAAAYDPAARGYIVDATPADRQGEAFGLYGAAQMGGLLAGPAIGAVGTSLAGSDAFVFIVAALTSLLSGVLIAVVVRERPRAAAAAITWFPPGGVVEMSSSSPPGGAMGQYEAERHAVGIPPPRSLANRRLTSAIVFNLGSFFAAGVYEVVWSVFLTDHLGAGLDLVGATFAAFALPVLLLSPVAGRFVDRRGSLAFIVAGMMAMTIAGILYTVIPAAILSIPIILFESVGFAMLSPALYAVVASGSPPGRSSTAQGLFGAAGTVGFIVASLVAGQLAAQDLRYPFWAFAVMNMGALMIGLAIGGRSIRSAHPTDAARLDGA